MKRILFIIVTAGVLTVGGASAASAVIESDIDCDGRDDITGQPLKRANGVCGGV